MGQFTALAAAVLSLGSCDRFTAPEILDCEAQVMTAIQTPGTYKRVSAHRVLIDQKKSPEVWASVTYDAQNEYGALVRDTKICKYPAKGGQVDWAAADQERNAEIRAQDAVLKQYERTEPTSRAATLGESQKPSRFPYVAPDGVDITNARDEANWKKYGTTDPTGGD